MVHVLNKEQVLKTIARSMEGDILVIGRVSWYHENDLAVNGWVHFQSKGRYTDQDLVYMILKYQEEHVWWLH